MTPSAVRASAFTALNPMIHGRAPRLTASIVPDARCPGLAPGAGGTVAIGELIVQRGSRSMFRAATTEMWAALALVLTGARRFRSRGTPATAATNKASEDHRVARPAELCWRRGRDRRKPTALEGDVTLRDCLRG